VLESWWSRGGEKADVAWSKVRWRLPTTRTSLRDPHPYVNKSSACLYQLFVTPIAEAFCYLLYIFIKDKKCHGKKQK
jgi:hypothetical protein